MSNKNNHLVLISGVSGTGKSFSLKDLKNPEGVIYLNCENNKDLPFPNKFKEFTITDPMQVYQAFDEAENMPEVHTIIIDTLTFLMDMFESTKILTVVDTQKAWGDYFQYMRVLMSQKVAKSTKNVIFLAHASNVYNKAELIEEVMVQVKGSLMKRGIESFFSNVISTKRVLISKLTDKTAKSKLCVLTQREKDLEHKYVFQTQLTKETINERIKGPFGMWDTSETFIDNNLQLVLDRLHEYYK